MATLTITTGRGRLFRPAAKAECSILFRARADYQYVIGYYSNREKAGPGSTGPKESLRISNEKPKNLRNYRRSEVSHEPS
jgi:hypothetical protein